MTPVQSMSRSGVRFRVETRNSIYDLAGEEHDPAFALGDRDDNDDLTVVPAEPPFDLHGDPA
jgi:hypothetical protein